MKLIKLIWFNLLFFNCFYNNIFSIEYDAEELKNKLNFIEQNDNESMPNDLILHIVSTLETIDEVKNIFDGISRLNKTPITENNIQYTLDILSLKFKVPYSYIAAKLDNEASLNWLKSQINSNDITDIKQYIESNSENIDQAKKIYNAFRKIYTCLPKSICIDNEIISV